MSNAKRYLDALFRTMASVARLFSARCWSNLEMIGTAASTISKCDEQTARKAKKLALVHPGKILPAFWMSIIALQIEKIAPAPGVVFLAETLTVTHQSPKCTYMSYMDSDHEIR